MLAIKSQTTRLLAIDGIFEGGRMLVGATSTTYLLQSGLTLTQIAFIKSVQAVTFIIAEVPTGVLADMCGPIVSLFFGAILSALGALVYFFAKSLGGFVIAELMTAISLCFWSGAFEAQALTSLSITNAKLAASRFFHLNTAVNNWAVLLAGLLGSLIGNHALGYSYIAMAVAMGFCSLGLIAIYADKSKKLEQAKANDADSFTVAYTVVVQQLRETLRHGILSPKLRSLFFAMIAAQFFFQPVLHYWQPYFQSLSPDFGPNLLGVVFALYCGTSAVFSHWYARKKANLVGSNANLFLALVCAALGMFLGITRLPWMAVFAFCCLQGFMAVWRTSATAEVAANSPVEYRASILSSMSLISRFGMLASLGTIGSIMAPKAAGVTRTPSNLFLIYATIALVVFAIVGLRSFFKILTGRFATWRSNA